MSTNHFENNASEQELSTDGFDISANNADIITLIFPKWAMKY